MVAKSSARYCSLYTGIRFLCVKIYLLNFVYLNFHIPLSFNKFGNVALFVDMNSAGVMSLSYDF